LRKFYFSTKANKWNIFVETPKAGGPYTITIESDTVIKIKNVLIGEVWVCSGQSNMELPFKDDKGKALVENADKAISEANYPNIRLFTVKKKISTTPEENCEGEWKICSPSTIVDFSVVAYYFGKELTTKLNVPVGLINTSWGGTPCQSWMNYEYVSKYPELKAAFDNIAKYANDSNEYNKVYKEWLYKTGIDNNEHKGYAEKWMNPQLDVSSWDKMKVPLSWLNTKLLENFVGAIWYRREIEIPESWTGKELTLELGTINEMDVTWINGNKIGGHYSPRDQWTPRKYFVKPEFFKAGKNILVVRVMNSSRGGGIDGKDEQLKIYLSGEGDKNAINLSGEWLYKIDFEAKNLPVFPNKNLNSSVPTSLFNGMINPLINYGIRGAIWYQGESNAHVYKMYEKTFPDLVKSWREKWNEGDFPFYYVQIAPYYYSYCQSQFQREVQLKSLNIIPNCGMAVTMDIGDSANIHPLKKEEVGKRLSYWALAKTYNIKGIAYSGPLYEKMEIQNNKIKLYFKYADNGLIAKGGDLKHFQIAGSDSIFHNAKAEIVKNNIFVSSSDVKNPIAVRFGWSNTAITNLFNKEGLPASSFRTDNWEK